MKVWRFAALLLPFLITGHDFSARQKMGKKKKKTVYENIKKKKEPMKGSILLVK